MIKVLHVYRTYFPDTQGGLEETIRQICLNTKLQGIESRVISLSRHTNLKVLQQEEGEIYRYKLNFEIASCGFSMNAFKAFQQHVEWADVINYHYPWPFADLLHFFSATVNKPVIITYHSDVIRQQSLLKMYAPLMRRFLQSAQRIVVTSPRYLSTSETLQSYQAKCDVIPIGLSQKIHPIVNQQMLQVVKKRYGENFFLFIGVLRYYKGLKYLLAAIQDTPLKVVIAGSGPEENRLKKLTKKLQLTNVIFAGQVSDEEKVALLKLSTAVVLPSMMRSEAFGVMLLEGAIYAKPLITTEIGTGTSFVNQHEVTGFVVKPSNPVALRLAMQKLADNPKLAQKMGLAAQRWYQEKFTGEMMGERYSQLYKQVIKEFSYDG